MKAVNTSFLTLETVATYSTQDTRPIILVALVMLIFRVALRWYHKLFSL
jgi:hypothetical protein